VTGAATNGTANTGGGGGGAFSTNQAGNGGSGAVFVRYVDTLPNMVIGTGLVIDDGSGGNVNGDNTAKTPSFTTGGFKVYFFKSGTGTVSF